MEEQSYEKLLYVCQNMREWDRREIFSTLYHDSAEFYAHDIMVAKDQGAVGFVMGHGDEPIAFVGAIPMWPGVVSVGMFATDSFGKIGLALTKFVIKRMIPALLNIGVHRGQCFSMEGHTVAHRWLEMLGFKREAEVLAFGKNRETFYLYSWMKPGSHPAHNIEPS